MAPLSPCSNTCILSHQLHYLPHRSISSSHSTYALASVRLSLIPSSSRRDRSRSAMVAHASIYCNATTTTTARSGPAYSAVAPKSSPRNTKRRSGRKATRTTAGRRRCVEAIRRKMEALRRLVPSGGDHRSNDEVEDDGVDELLFRAADYIVRLQVQVKAMQLMVDVLEHTKDS
uniref:BHLH domain-containing protein n=2 Tax=Aegilops tauschii TaxID=37682 RepID=A0A452Y2J1_AEGTS|nr:uncharacterized protein LOC109751039 [Aegilops tauschii subsp. strangulata]